MAYERKTIDTWELQLNYGYGWEYTLTEFTREEARARLKENSCRELECMQNSLRTMIFSR